MTETIIRHKEELKTQKEELNLQISNLEDRIKTASAIANKAKGEMKVKEDFIRELIADKDNAKNKLACQQEELNKTKSVINSLQQTNAVLEQKIKSLEREHTNKIESMEKDYTSRLDEQREERRQTQKQLDKLSKELKDLRDGNLGV